MIAARIGLDRFLAWRIPLTAAQGLLPPGPPPVAEDGRAWLLFAAARLERVRVAGCPVPAGQVAAWLVPCALPDGMIGNAFVAGFADRRPLAWAMSALGVPRVRTVAIDHRPEALRVPGEASAEIGPARDMPGSAWFERDRCGLLPRARGWLRLPLAKRSWAWHARAAALEAPFAAALGGEPAGVFDCSGDEARWGMPRRLGAGVATAERGATRR